MMAVLDLFDGGSDLAAEFPGPPHAEDFADTVRRQTPQADFAAALEDFMDGEVAFEDEVAAVFDLRQRVEARQVHLAAFPLGELWSEEGCPVVELLADDLWTESISRCLQRRCIFHGEEGIVVLAEADVGPLQLLLDERVAVEPIRGVEREEACHAQDDGPQNFIPNVEVVMGETAALVREDAVVRIPGGILRNGDAERPALFHALEDEVNAVSVRLLDTAQRGQHVILFANSLFGPFDRNAMVAGVRFDPGLIITGALAQNFLVHHRETEDLAEEVDHLFGPGQPVQIAVDDDAVEAVVYQSEQIAEQQGEQFHRNFTLRKGGRPWGAERSDTDRASARSAARISGWPTKSL